MLLGSPVPLPVALSPVGAPQMSHHEGELAAARAASAAGIVYGVSILGTKSVEAIANDMLRLVPLFRTVP
jgi:isopentenyl diphosphate isomerase/L-lactate dehydrogenase-like FMN-dependent dehydrogenase